MEPRIRPNPRGQSTVVPTPSRWAAASRPAALALVAVMAVLAVALLVGFLSDTYGPIDPTDPGWKALITNDTGRAIRVKNSAGDLLIAAGQRDIIVSPGPGQIHVVYRIEDDHANVLGCLTVDLDKRKTVDVRASAMRPCPG